MTIRPFFADDIFISYARKDSSTYASGLADELTRRGFSCFIDRLGTEANRELPSSLRRKVRGCSMLVVVATRWSGSRESIKDEIVEFKKTKRPIVPIDIDDSILQAAWYEHVEGIAPEPEKNSNALEDGNPTPAVISRIEKAFHYTRRNERLRRWTVLTAAILMLLIAVSFVAARTAANELANARKASAEAQSAKAAADRAKGEAEDARKEAIVARAEADQATADAKAAKSEAKLAKTEATAATRKAEEQTQLAQAATIRAQQATANADKQQAIAVGRQTAIVAGSRRVQSLRLQEGWADMLQHSVLLAVEADRRLSAQGIPPAESEQALRDSLDLLPRAVKKFEHAHSVKGAILPPGGEYLITKEDDGFMRVWDGTSHKQISEMKLHGEVIFNASRTLMAMENKGGGASVWKLPQAEPLCKNEWDLSAAELCKKQTSKYGFLKFSHDGKYLAAAVSSPGSSDNAQPSRSILVWDMRNGQRATEVKYEGNLLSFALGPDGNVLALSLTRPGEGERARDSRRGSRVDPAEDNLLQIWKVKSPVAVLIREAVVRPKATTKGFHGEPVFKPLSDLSFSPDGKLLAANTGYHATIFEIASAEEVTFIRGPNPYPEQGPSSLSEKLVHVEFGGNGSSIGTIGQDGSLHAWDVATGNNIWNEHLASSHHSDWKGPYAVINKDGGTRLVDVRTGTDVARVLQDLTVAADYAPQADRVVFFHEHQVWLYDIGSAQELARVKYDGRTYLQDSNFGADGRYFALTEDKKVVVWDVMNAQKISRMDHTSTVGVFVAFSPDGAYMATVSWDDSLQVWETGTGRKLWQTEKLPLTGLDEDGEMQLKVASLYFSPGQKFVVLETYETSETGDSIFVWDLRSQREFARTQRSEIFQGTYESGEVFFTADDRFMVLHGGDKARLLDTSNGAEVATLPQEKGDGRVVFSPDNKLLARSHKGTVEVLKVRGGGGLYKLPLGGETSRYVFSRDARFLAAIGGNEGVILDVTTGDSRVIRTEKPVTRMRVSPNGRYLFSESDSGEDNKAEVSIWELASGRQLPRYLNDGVIGEVVFSPNDSRVAIFATEAHTVYLVNSETGRADTTLYNGGRVEKVSFSPDGEYIAVVGGDLVRVWEVRTLRELARLQHGGKVSLATFVPGGHQLATVSEDLIARVWIIEEDKLVERACERLTRNLRPDEWQRAFSGEKLRSTCANLPLAAAEDP